MSTVMDTNVVKASEPLVEMAETKDVKLDSPHGKEINNAAVTKELDTSNDASKDGAANGDIKVPSADDTDGAINGDNKVVASTDNAGAKSSSDEGAMNQETPKTTPTAPKKRGAKTDGDGGPPKKKRSSPKAKKVKEEGNQEEDGEAGVPETPVKKTAARAKGGKGKNKTNGSADPVTPPKTPKVKGSVKVGNNDTGAVMSDVEDDQAETSTIEGGAGTKKAPKVKGVSKVGNGFTGSALSDDEGNEAGASITEGPAITKKGAARKRAFAGKISNNVPISTSLETASPQDKMLFKMKEEGKSWAEIREAWETMTGEKTKNSTLPNRYVRLKSNFMTLKEGDGARLLAARAEVEADIEAHIAKLRGEQWAKVQKIMEDKGTTEKYPTPFLIKKYEELSAKPAVTSDDEVKGTSDDGKADIKMEDAGEEDGAVVDAAAAEDI